MTDPFPIADDLPAILDDIWVRLTRGAADRKSPMHTPIVGTVGPGGTCEQRVMVLRKVDRRGAILRFHTDIRSTKVAGIEGAPVGVIGYDPGRKVQVRAQGTATVLTDCPDVEAAWATTTLSGRRSYLTILPPGTVVGAATSGLPDQSEMQPAVLQATNVGRANFALVIVTLTQVEWLRLTHDGHRRARFTRSGTDWAGEWLIP